MIKLVATGEKERGCNVYAVEIDGFTMARVYREWNGESYPHRSTRGQPGWHSWEIEFEGETGWHLKDQLDSLLRPFHHPLAWDSFKEVKQTIALMNGELLNAVGALVDEFYPGARNAVDRLAGVVA